MEFLPGTTIPIITRPEHPNLNRFVNSYDIYNSIGAKKGYTTWMRLRLNRLNCAEGLDYFCDKVTHTNKKVSKRRVYFVSVRIAAELLAVGLHAEGSLEKRFHDNYTPLPETGCWIWDSTLSMDEYGRMRHGGRRRLLATHVSWELHNGIIPEGMNVLHKCDIPSCVNPNHLFLGTQKDNMQDMMSKDRSGFIGSRNFRALLSEESVAQARILYDAGYPIKPLAERYGVNHATMSLAVRRITWKHVV